MNEQTRANEAEVMCVNDSTPALWPKRRRRVTWKSALLGFVLINVAIVSWGYWKRLTEARAQLNAALEETNALDPRWEWHQLVEDAPRIPWEENSIRVLAEIAQLVGRWDTGEPRLPPSPKDWNGIDVLRDWPENCLLDEERLKLIRATLEKHPEALKLALTLQRYPQGFKPVVLAPDVASTLLPHVQNARAPYRLLELDSERMLNEEGPCDLRGHFYSILNAGASVRHDGFHVAQLVRAGGRGLVARRLERMLAIGEQSDEILAELGHRIQSERMESPFEIAFRGERAAFHFFMLNVESGKVPLGIPDERTATNFQRWRAGALLFLSRPKILEDHAFSLRSMNEYCGIMTLPPQERLGAGELLDAYLQSQLNAAAARNQLIFSNSWLPSNGKLVKTSVRDLAMLLCAETALAAERYRLAHGCWPARGSDLVPKYMVEEPMDPYDGKPLRIVAFDRGIVIYSIGENCLDDGGTHVNVPGHLSAPDIGFRLWDPELRRLPAPDKKE